MHDLTRHRTGTPVQSRVVQDPNRPGPSRVRLVPEEIPVWALIGLAKALAEERQAPVWDEAVVHEVAHDYGISVDAARVTLDWYERHPHAIDTVLADNAAYVDHAASAAEH